MKSYKASPNNNTAINQTASILRETIVQKSCGVDFCLDKEKEKNLYSIVHFNNFSDGVITPPPRPEEENESLFGTTPVSIDSVFRERSDNCHSFPYFTKFYGHIYNKKLTCCEISARLVFKFTVI